VAGVLTPKSSALKLATRSLCAYFLRTTCHLVRSLLRAADQLDLEMINMTRSFGFSVVLSGIALACAADPPPPAQSPIAPMAPAYTAPAAAAPVAPPGQDPQQSNVSISDAIRKACGISETEAYFAFNSSNVRSQDKAVLGKLAQCFMSGPLKGRQMLIVGRADSRGEDEYNMVLGEKRAGNVKAAIGKEGLTLAKMNTNSRGEMDANGTDEASWEKDRRVDILLSE